MLSNEFSNLILKISATIISIIVILGFLGIFEIPPKILSTLENYNYKLILFGIIIILLIIFTISSFKRGILIARKRREMLEKMAKFDIEIRMKLIFEKCFIVLIIFCSCIIIIYYLIKIFFLKTF